MVAVDLQVMRFERCGVMGRIALGAPVNFNLNMDK